MSLALVPFPSVGNAHRRSVSVMSHGPSIYHLHRRRCGPHTRVFEKAHRSALPHLSFCSCEKLLSFFSTGLHDSFSDVAIILWQSLNPQLKFIVLHRKVFEFDMITSINVGT